MPNFYSPTGNYEIWAEKPSGYFTQEEWAELHPNSVNERNIEELREAKMEEIAGARYNAETAGISWGDYSVATDRESQAMITGATLAAIQDSKYTVRWKTSVGFIELNAAQIIAVAHGLREHVQRCFDKEATLSSSIQKAETVEEVESVIW